MFIHRQYNAVARNRFTRKRSSSALDKVNAKSATENATSNLHLKLPRESQIRLAAGEVKMAG